MSDKELQKLDIIKRLNEQEINRTHAAQLLGRSVRQTQRLLKKYRKLGVHGLVSKKRGVSSNRKLPVSVQEYAMHLVSTRYTDFGPTFACEKLRECHDVKVSVATLRTWMIASGIWITRAQRRGRVHQPRHRRSGFGELIQIDGSLHD